MNILELLYWFTGSLGVLFSAQGLTGLRLKRNAEILWGLTDPLGRYDFHFSEGQFDLIVCRLEQDFALSMGAALLLTSLALSSAAGICKVCWVQPPSVWANVGIRIGTFLAGVIVWLLTKHRIRKVTIWFSAKEMERRASASVSEDRRDKASIETMLGNWFRKRVGRNPVISDDERN